ncbi:hypothetical protein [Streptomyces sp. NPDC008141]|uniref:hypothetical protein n=1 Tax=Streptomyces sp. NPDC008141 TaxID=3364815 RepID=UPI0036DFF275
MTTNPRQPFSVRLGRADDVDEAPYEGVPRHLMAALRAWVGRHFTDDDHDAVELCLRLRLVQQPHSSPRATLLATDGWDLLDVVDALLGYEGEDGWNGRDEGGELARLLDAAGSAYRVNNSDDGLELRITPSVRDAVGQTVSDARAAPLAGSAAEHLTASWKAAYGIYPDPVRAYGEAIKAVECAAHVVIQPNHSRATLGTMLGELKGGARSKFTTALATGTTADPIAPVEELMRALWDGQTSRHGKQTATVPETLESARAAVHLAAALVQWFTSGAVVRSP